MKKTVKLMSLLLVLATPLAFSAEGDAARNGGAQANPAAQPYKYKTPKLSRAQIDALLAKPDQLLIIDVRRPDELTSIGGFPTYLSIQSTELEKHLAFIPRDRTIVTVSNHAGRAGAAADLLAGKGFKVAGAIGAQNYEEEGGTLTKVAPVPPKTADAGKP